MARTEPVTELDARYSSEGAGPTDWATGRESFAGADVYWLVTVREDGRPHVTPLIAVWLDDAAYIHTGPDEQKARNIVQNPHCTLMTGVNTFAGVDVVIEGDGAAGEVLDIDGEVDGAVVARAGGDRKGVVARDDDGGPAPKNAHYERARLRPPN